MTDKIVDLAAHRRQRNARPRYLINPVWPLIILACLTVWGMLALLAVALIPQISEFLESILA